MSKTWGNIGAWAAEAERADEEERAAEASKPEANNFPSLKESIAAKPKKKKMTLSEFNSSVTAAAPGSYGSLTHDERLRLPTGPKERSIDDDDRRNFGGRLGGGFSSYGDRSDGPSRYDGGGRRGGFDDDRRGPPPSRVSDFEPSRADEADNWAATKKPMASFNNTLSRPGGGNARYESLGGGGSRSDDVDNWAMGKRAQAPPMSAPDHSRSSSGFGSGFRDSRDQGMESDRWTRGGGGFGDGGRSERPRLVLDPPSRSISGNTVENLNEGVKSHRANPFGVARPREEVLAEKGLDYKKVDLEIAAIKSVGVTSGGSRPSSAQSSRSHSQGDEGGVKPRPRVNPFGDAKPREVLLEEKGLDWRKIDSELDRRADRPLSEEEKMLKDEMENLRKEMERLVSLKDGKESAGNGADIGTLLAEKERELEALSRDLDDKARVGQKGIDRPGSRSGRAGGFSDRPSSRSGSIVDSRTVDYNDRLLSRGSGDAWARTGNERRGFQGARDREFSGSRDFDRSRSRDGW